MRIVIGVSAICGALVLSAIGPASAAELSSQDVARGYAVTMTKSEARQLGVTGKVLSTFGVTESDIGTPNAPWLCDLSNSDEVEGKGAATIVASGYISLGGQQVDDAQQEVHIFTSAKQAKAAYDGIVQKIKQCEGPQTPAADPETEEPAGMTTQLSNGTKKAADGDSFLWVRSETVVTGEGGFASHEYSTVRHFGRYLQVIQVDSQGSNAPNLTAKQIRTADKLTDSLGDRWRAAFS
jgi:hypothetical protein